MVNAKDDSKPQKIEAPKVANARAGSPDATRMLDTVLEDVGLVRDDGGSA